MSIVIKSQKNMRKVGGEKSRAFVNQRKEVPSKLLLNERDNGLVAVIFLFTLFLSMIYIILAQSTSHCTRPSDFPRIITIF